MQIYVILVFFFVQNLFPKTWKPLITKLKNWIGTFILPNEAVETCNCPEKVLRLDFVTPIPFDNFPWKVLCDLSLMKLGNI